MRYTHLLRAVHALVYSSFQPGKNSLTMMLFSQEKKKKDSYFKLLVNAEWLKLWIEIWKQSIYFTVLITKQRVFFLKAISRSQQPSFPTCTQAQLQGIVSVQKATQGS